mgnify:CR=1 FL=1
MQTVERREQSLDKLVNSEAGSDSPTNASGADDSATAAADSKSDSAGLSGDVNADSKASSAASLTSPTAGSGGKAGPAAGKAAANGVNGTDPAYLRKRGDLSKNEWKALVKCAESFKTTSRATRLFFRLNQLSEICARACPEETPAESSNAGSAAAGAPLASPKASSSAGAADKAGTAPAVESKQAATASASLSTADAMNLFSDKRVAEARAVLDELRTCDPQFHLNGDRNLWILKPGSLCNCVACLCCAMQTNAAGPQALCRADVASKFKTRSL